jgi:hypothetical protein
MASVICAPMRLVGFSDRAGSWNTIAMSRPRWRCSWRSPRPTSSSPSKQIDPVTDAVCGSRPMIARALTVLPDPDSPTIASVRPRSSS